MNVGPKGAKFSRLWMDFDGVFLLLSESYLKCKWIEVGNSEIYLQGNPKK